MVAFERFWSVRHNPLVNYGPYRGLTGPNVGKIGQLCHFWILFHPELLYKRHVLIYFLVVLIYGVFGGFWAI